MQQLSNSSCAEWYALIFPPNCTTSGDARGGRRSYVCECESESECASVSASEARTDCECCGVEITCAGDTSRGVCVWHSYMQHITAFYFPISVVTITTMLIMKVLLPLSLCGTRTTPVSLLFDRDMKDSCMLLSVSSIVNASVLLLLVIILSYSIAFAYLAGYSVLIKAFCALLYFLSLSVFNYAIVIKIIHLLNITVVDWITLVFFLWSLPVSIVLVVYFIESKLETIDNAVQLWRNKAIIVVAVSAVFCFSLLSEGTLYFIFLLMTAWDLVAVNWGWGPIRLMIDHQNRRKAVILEEQPHSLSDMNLVMELAKSRQRDILAGRTPRNVDDALDEVDLQYKRTRRNALQLPRGLSYQVFLESGVNCDLGVMDIILLGVTVGLAAKRPGTSVMFASHLAALIGASTATLQSISTKNTVPALPAALGTCFVVYVVCRVIKLQTFIDTIVDSDIYF